MSRPRDFAIAFVGIGAAALVGAYVSAAIGIVLAVLTILLLSIRRAEPGDE